MPCQLQTSWHPWPATAFIIVSVSFFLLSRIDRFDYLVVPVPALREEEIDHNEQLLFDSRNATTTSSTVVLSSHVDKQINSNLTVSSSSMQTSSSELSSTDATSKSTVIDTATTTVTSTSKLVPNNNTSLSQATKNEKKSNAKQQHTAKKSSPKTQTPHNFMEISLSHDNIHSLGKSKPEFVSATLDWWPIGTKGWDNSSVINANLSHPRLIATANGLRPYILRIGGSQADEIIYSMVDEPRELLEGSWRRKSSSNTTATIVHHKDDDGDDDGDEYNNKIAYECQKKPQKCLTKDRWDTVLNFAQQTGARVVFTLAYIRHTRGENHGEDHARNDSQDWDSRNARRFLEYTRAHENGGVVHGFELGNELRHKNKISNITRVVNAYKELGDMVNEIWGGTNVESDAYHRRPKILGPASTGVGETSYLLSQIGPYIQIASYHKYHGGGKDPKLPSYAQYPSFYPHPMKLSGPGEAVKKYMMNTAGNNSSATEAQLWVGEGAMAYDSGLHGLTDTFHGSLWFANILGALTKTKPLPHSVYCRQSLLGGYYELISHETLIPNPDYWVAYLWKRLVGQKAIGPIVSPQRKDSVKLSSYQTFGCCKQPGRDAVLIHSFCAKSSTGDVVFIVINTSESEAMYINVPMSEKNRTEYILTPNEAEGLKSRQVFLNGQQLSIHDNVSTSFVLPEVRELGVSRSRGEQFHVPPISIAFLVVHGSDVQQCTSAS